MIDDLKNRPSTRTAFPDQNCRRPQSQILPRPDWCDANLWARECDHVRKTHHWLPPDPITRPPLWYRTFVDGRWELRSIPFRSVSPAELDLMARLAGMSLRERWGGWKREPFTNDSTKHVSVWEKP